MKFQTIVAAVALAATGAANASLNNFESGDSSIAFVSFDATGAVQGSVFIDLGYNLSDFANTTFGDTAGSLGQAGTKVVWNFNNNTITKNGVVQTMTNDYSAFAAYSAAAGSDARWGVIGGNMVGVDDIYNFASTGTPSPTQLNSQADSSGLQLVAPLYNLTPLNAAVDNGSYFASANSDAAWVGSNATAIGTLGKWQNNLFWDATTTGTQTNFWHLNGTGEEDVIGKTPVGGITTGLLNNKGTFTLDKAVGTLTWQTASVASVTPSVPEPSSYALALVALAAVGVAARRKTK